jgi:hypothetical protein
VVAASNTGAKNKQQNKRLAQLSRASLFCLIFPLVERDVPTVGMKRSQVGNQKFPNWESNVPTLGKNRAF